LEGEGVGDQKKRVRLAAGRRKPENKTLHSARF